MMSTAYNQYKLTGSFPFLDSYHVVADSCGGWCVYRSMSKRASFKSYTKEAATQYAKKICERTGAIYIEEDGMGCITNRRGVKIRGKE